MGMIGSDELRARILELANCEFMATHNSVVVDIDSLQAPSKVVAFTPDGKRYEFHPVEPVPTAEEIEKMNADARLSEQKAKQEAVLQQERIDSGIERKDMVDYCAKSNAGAAAPAQPYLASDAVDKAVKSPWNKPEIVRIGSHVYAVHKDGMFRLRPKTKAEYREGWYDGTYTFENQGWRPVE